MLEDLARSLPTTKERVNSCEQGVSFNFFFETFAKGTLRFRIHQQSIWWLYRLDVRVSGLGCFSLYVKAHASISAGLYYFQRMRGETDWEDDVEDLRLILKKNWHRDMSSKKKWVQTSIDDINRAHNEFYEWTLDASYILESYLVDNEAVAAGQVVYWAETLRVMVVNDHDRLADFNELGCMRSVEALAKCAGL